MTENNVTPIRPNGDAIAALQRVTIDVPAALTPEQAAAIATETLHQFATWRERGHNAIAGVVMPQQAGCDLVAKLLGLGAHEGDWGPSVALATVILAGAVYPSPSPEVLQATMTTMGTLARTVSLVAGRLGAQPKVSESEGKIVFSDEASGKAVPVDLGALPGRCAEKGWRVVAEEMAAEIADGLRLLV